MSAPKGYSSQEKEDRLSAQFQTIEPVREKQFGSSVVSHQFVFQVETNAIVGAGSTASIIQCVGHQARKGDVLYFLTLGREARVWETTANTISLAETLPSAPGSGDIFEIRRHRYPLVDSAGTLQTSSVEVATAALGDPLPALVKVIGGWDSNTNDVYPVAVDSTGAVGVNVLSSALPSGAATEATLATLATEATVATLATEATVATLATEATLSALDAKVTAVDTGNVTVVSSSLPTGAATETTLATLATEATVSTLGTETTLLAVKTAVEAIENTVSGSELRVDVVTSALPAGAATEATLGDIKTSVQLIDDCVGTDGVAAPAKSFVIAGVTSGGLQQTIEVNASGHVNIADGGGSITVDATSWPLPTGAATESTLSTLNGKVTACNTGAVTISTALPSGTNTIGKVDVNTLSVIDLLDAGILDTSTTNIPGSASNPVQVVSSTAAATKKLQLLDTTGAFIGVYTGAALSEVLQFVMGPGSDQTIEHSIPASTRISLKRLDSTTAVSSGIVAINFIG